MLTQNISSANLSIVVEEHGSNISKNWTTLRLFVEYKD